MRQARLLNSAGSLFCCIAAKLVGLMLFLGLEVMVPGFVPDAELDGKTSGSNPGLEGPCH